MAKAAAFRNKKKATGAIPVLYERVFATVCDEQYFSGLWALLNSIYAYHLDELRIFLFDYGLSDEQRGLIERHPLVIEIVRTDRMPIPPSGPWEAKQKVFATLMSKAVCVLLLDCDLVITSRMDDVFEAAERGKIVSSTDGLAFEFSNSYRVYSEALAGLSQPHINTGCLCFNLRLHWDLVGLWAFTAEYGVYSANGGYPLHLPGHGDQGIFNALCGLLGKAKDFERLGEEEWCDCTKGCALKIESTDGGWKLAVLNCRTNGRQRIVHSSGPKWWTAKGKEFLNQAGDKLRIFEFFYERLPISGKRIAPEREEQRAGEVVIAVCSCWANRKAREAIRETWGKSLPAGFSLRFFMGEAAQNSDEPDVVALPVPDDYESLPAKVQALLRFCLREFDFDAVFKCDDDTYLVPERLLQLPSAAIDIVGDTHVQSHGWFSGGAGYLLSRMAVRKLADITVPLTGPEDVIFSKIAQFQELRVLGDARLRADARIMPNSLNDFITAHGLKPEGMLVAHENYKETQKRSEVPAA